MLLKIYGYVPICVRKATNTVVHRIFFFYVVKENKEVAIFLQAQEVFLGNFSSQNGSFLWLNKLYHIVTISVYD